MKKRLEAELISIAHRVLKLKNKSEVDQLFLETQKLYEALSVLKFYGDHIEQAKATISEEDLEEKLTISLEVEPIKIEAIQEPIAVVEEIAEEVEEPIIVGEISIDEEEEIEEELIAEEDSNFDPIFEMASEEMEEEIIPESAKPQQILFEDLLGENYQEPEFVKPNDTSKIAATKMESSNSEKQMNEEVADTIVEDKKEKMSILNDKLATGINIGLNDRVGFVKYLFDNSTEDYNRVLSQLNTFDTFAEAKEFIEDMVKPDYSNWIGQEDFAERFMEIVEKKFG